MQYAIVVSKKDPAGLNILEHLKKGAKEKFDDNPVYKKSNITIYTLSTDTIHSENLDKMIEADLFIFATRHQSKAGTHSMSCHAPGNWAEASAGGINKALCNSSALLLKSAYLEFLKHNGKLPDHEITLECTHHGPYLEKPCIFVEIGSTEDQWKNPIAGKIVSEVILKMIDNKPKTGQKIAIGIGGPHYCNTICGCRRKSDSK